MRKINPIKNLGAFAHPPKGIGRTATVKRPLRRKPLKLKSK
jgi:hypothetical protein